MIISMVFALPFLTPGQFLFHRFMEIDVPHDLVPYQHSDI
jgi:hypothetical protein